MDTASMERHAARAAIVHLVASLLLLAGSLALAPGKFERAGAVFAILAAVLLAGGALAARSAWRARARHGIEIPGWSPFDRGWWAWDPPVRAFHWSLCAYAMLLTWILVLAATLYESAAGIRLPVALDALVEGAGQFLTGFGASLFVGAGGYLLARRWARRTIA